MLEKKAESLRSGSAFLLDEAKIAVAEINDVGKHVIDLCRTQTKPVR